MTRTLSREKIVSITIQSKDAIANLLSGKLRSFLAILGILVGTASVVAMVSSGELATQQTLAQFKKLGTDLLSVSIGEAGKQATKNTGFTPAQVSSLKPPTDNIIKAAPYTDTYANIYYHGHKINANLIGATENLEDVIKINLQQGRFISNLDNYQHYCVIGKDIAEQLKKYAVYDPVGRQLQIGTEYFTVVGVAEHWPENSFFNGDINRSIIITIPAATTVSKFAKINNVILRLRPDADIDATQKIMTNYINQIAPGKQLYFRSAKELINSMIHQKQILTILLGLIGSISLIVGGIGVMNIMLVSVVERKREIGIRKAIGAKRSDIQLLFLIEAVTLSLFGGALGVILGILTSYIISIFAHWHFKIFILPPVIGFAVSASIGIFFGFYPAYQAARLNPIECLRSE